MKKRPEMLFAGSVLVEKPVRFSCSSQLGILWKVWVSYCSNMTKVRVYYVLVGLLWAYQHIVRSDSVWALLLQWDAQCVFWWSRPSLQIFCIKRVNGAGLFLDCPLRKQTNFSFVIQNSTCTKADLSLRSEQRFWPTWWPLTGIKRCLQSTSIFSGVL